MRKDHKGSSAAILLH